MPRSSRPDALGSFLHAIADDGELSRIRERMLGSGKVVGDRYQLRACIARGGMATIWEADDRKLGRSVAIKFMGQAYAGDADYRKRFEEEAKAAASLSTPHVAQIHDHGVTEGVPYIVMERLHGEDLHARLERLGRLARPLVGQIATEGCRALKAAHAAGIIHRDLKPKNLFIAKHDDGEIIKLLDFGVAKHAGTAELMTATGVMLGSPFYMSPEQVRCERDLDARTDLWAFAAILYRTLTGVKAFEGDITTVMYKITHERPPAPSSIVRDLPPELDAFFEKALATRREDRFANALEMSEAFRIALTRRSGTSGVRAIALPEPDAAPDTNAVESEVAQPRRFHPSDHPTIAAPLATLTMLGSDGAGDAPTTGLRLGHTPQPPAEPRVDRATEPNLWVNTAALTIEQEHGFSNPDAAEVESRWQFAEREADTGPMQTRTADEQSRAYVIGGIVLVVLVLALTFGLAWVLHA